MPFYEKLTQSYISLFCVFRGRDITWDNIQDDSLLATVIFEEFSQKEAKERVDMREVENYVWLRTPFVFRKKPLKMLENSARLIVAMCSDPARKYGTFPDGQIFVFTFDHWRSVPIVNMVFFFS